MFNPLRILTIACSLLLFLGTAAAQFEPIVFISVVGLDSNPFGGVTIIADSSTGFPDFSETDQDGKAAFYFIDPEKLSSYVFQVKPSESFFCDICGGLSDTTLSASELTLNDQGVYTATVVLESASQVATVSVEDSQGNPVQGAYVSGFSFSGSGYGSGESDQNGTVVFAVSAGNWSFDAFKDGYSSAREETNIPALAPLGNSVDSSDPSNIKVTLVLEQADKIINFSFTKDGLPYTTTAEFGSVFCYSEGENFDDFKSFFADVSQGATSATVQVTPGTYVCDAYLGEDTALTQVSVTVSETDQQVNVEYQIVSADYKIQVQFKDKDGNLVDADVEVFAHTDFQSSLQHLQVHSNPFQLELMNSR